MCITITIFNILMFSFIFEANISLSYFFLTLFIVSKLCIQLNLLLFTYVTFFPLSSFQFRKISPLLQVDSCSVVSESLRPHELQLARCLCPRTSPGKNTGVRSQSLLQGDLPNPGIEPRSPAFQADSLPTELSGKPLSGIRENTSDLCLWILAQSQEFLEPW